MMKFTVIFIVVLIIGLGQEAVDGAAVKEKIYNGYNAARGQFPYQTLQRQKEEIGFSFCGGCLILTQWVMTAAHCAYQVNFTTVFVGLVNTADGTETTQYSVTEPDHHVHPDYNPTNAQNDIALLKLPSNVQTSEYVRPINLPKMDQANSDTFDNQMVTASGWGQTQDTEPGIHQILQYRTINVFPHSQCVTYYKNVNNVTDGMICTDKRIVYSGPCHGDSGGPLTLNGTDGEPFVIGTVSWGVGGCSSNNPVVFTNVAYYLEWINNVTGIAVT